MSPAKPLQCRSVTTHLFSQHSLASMSDCSLSSHIPALSQQQLCLPDVAHFAVCTELFLAQSSLDLISPKLDASFQSIKMCAGSIKATRGLNRVYEKPFDSCVALLFTGTFYYARTEPTNSRTQLEDSYIKSSSSNVL